MFDEDDHTNLVLITTKQFGARIGMVEDNKSHGDKDKESTEGDEADWLQQHAQQAKRERNKAEAAVAASGDLV